MHSPQKNQIKKKHDDTLYLSKVLNSENYNHSYFF